MLSYNIKRTLNILTFDDLMKKLKSWKPKYRKTWRLKSKITLLASIKPPGFYEWKIAA